MFSAPCRQGTGWRFATENQTPRQIAGKSMFPEGFLEYSDWLGILIQAYPVTLDRFKSLLLGQAGQLVTS